MPAAMPYEWRGIDPFPALPDEDKYKPTNFDVLAFNNCIDRYEFINGNLFFKVRWLYSYKKYRLECLYSWKYHFLWDVLEEGVSVSDAIKNNTSISLVYRAQDGLFTKEEVSVIDARINETFQN